MTSPGTRLFNAEQLSSLTRGNQQGCPASFTCTRCSKKIPSYSVAEVWNKTVDMEFSGKEPLVFSIYSKDAMRLNCRSCTLTS